MFRPPSPMNRRRNASFNAHLFDKVHYDFRLEPMDDLMLVTPNEIMHNKDAAKTVVEAIATSPRHENLRKHGKGEESIVAGVYKQILANQLLSLNEPSMKMVEATAQSLRLTKSQTLNMLRRYGASLQGVHYNHPDHNSDHMAVHEVLATLNASFALPQSGGRR